MRPKVSASAVGGIVLGALVPLVLGGIWLFPIAMSGGTVWVACLFAVVNACVVFLVAYVLVKATHALYAWIACVVVTAGILMTETFQVFIVVFLTAPLVLAIPSVVLILHRPGDDLEVEETE